MARQTRKTQAFPHAKIASDRTRTFSSTKGKAFVYFEIREIDGDGGFAILADPPAHVRARVRSHMRWLLEEARAAWRATQKAD